jgi:hypothetical protein
MPNWCENVIQVETGTQEQIQKFAEDVNGRSILDFDKLVSTPKELLESNEWYHWRLENWGTKWEADCPAGKPDGFEFVQGLYFMTAWSPPVAWFDRVAKLYPHLSFTLYFYEGGNAFAGVVRWENGERVIDRNFEYGSDEYENIQQGIFCAIDE